MKSTGKELRVRISHVHHVPPHHTAYFEVSDTWWARAFGSHDSAEEVAGVVRRTMCNNDCPKVGTCDKAHVEGTQARFLNFVVVANSKHNIFHKGSRATCVRHSRKKGN